MYDIINVGARPGGDAFLLRTGQEAALVDSGYAFCAGEMVEKLKNALGGRRLRYILLTHSHYDHVSGSPLCKRTWPEAQVVATEYAAGVFKKPGAIKTMREMNDNAARQWGVDGYEDLLDELSVDLTVSDGDVLPLGDITLEVLAAPGHTKCSIAFFSPEEKLLLACETYGTMGDSPVVMPAYLVGCQMTLDSIDRAEKCAPEAILLPHYKLITGQRAKTFLPMARRANEETFRIVAEGYRAGKSVEQLMAEFKDKYYTEEQALYQPEAAFMLNLSNMIPMLIRESGQ